ncbi:hypothetical protein [Paenibacillus pini]|uniref:Uncharacterized protein n=1 Tax=Paenibacillus pini JCM 16418 TaxID=1236976 RepID=W7YL92_9BACL|nr:hypothetical protein [Paenibacillus pini]GAF08523.1 hypothetical protein JCM16418_2605 [Paenibacillus pini JCM 16418]
MNKQDETDLMKEAKTIAVQHLKEKYEIDVEITKQKMLPTYVNDEITMEGHVIGHPDQSFNIAVDYKEKKTMNFAMSPELVSAIRAKGHEPFIKK